LRDDDVANEIQAIRKRLGELGADAHREGVAQELGAIRAHLRLLASANSEVGQRLGESLGLRQPRRDER
jgi:hypothetical protein